MKAKKTKSPAKKAKAVRRKPAKLAVRRRRIAKKATVARRNDQALPAIAVRIAETRNRYAIYNGLVAAAVITLAIFAGSVALPMLLRGSEKAIASRPEQMESVEHRIDHVVAEGRSLDGDLPLIVQTRAPPTAGTKSEVKTETDSQAKSAAKAEAKAETKPAAKSEAESETRIPATKKEAQAERGATNQAAAEVKNDRVNDAKKQVKQEAKSRGKTARRHLREAAVKKGAAGLDALASAPASAPFGNDLIAEARKYLGGNPTGRASVWCGAFLDMVLRRTGHRGGGNLARGYINYGTRLPGPEVGAIVVFSRTGGGHVGIVTGVDANGNPVVISGNHNHRVAIATYPAKRVLAYVRPNG